MTTTRNKLSVVPPGKPPTVPERDYQDFDRWVAIADRMVGYVAALTLACERLQDDGDRKPTTADVQLAERLMGEYTDQQINALMVKFKAGEDWYNRPELFDKLDDQPGWGGVTFEVVAQQMAVLLGSFPNSVPHNPEIYTRLLIDEIYGSQPGAVSLEGACRRWRRKEKFNPTSAELLQYISREDTRWCDRWQVMDTTSDRSPIVWRKDLQQAIEQTKAKLELRGPKPKRRWHEWFRLPLALRHRWWKETDYGNQHATPELISECQAALDLDLRELAAARRRPQQKRSAKVKRPEGE